MTTIARKGAVSTSGTVASTADTYQGSVAGESLDQIFTPGTHTVSGMTDGPIGTSVGMLRETHNDVYWHMQELFMMLSTEIKYVRINRPSKEDTDPDRWGEWTLAEARHKLDKKNVVFIGDSITASYNLPYYFGLETGANVTNCGVGGARLARHTSAGYKELSGFKIAKAMAADKLASYDGVAWDTLITAAALTDDVVNNVARMQALKDMDWSTVDYMVIGYGTNDFGGGVTIDLAQTVDPAGSTSGYYFNVTVKLMVEDIITTHPHIKLLWWTPLWRGVTPTATTGIEFGSDVSPNTLGNYLQDYVDQMVIAFKLHNQSYLDLHDTSGICEATRLYYLNDLNQSSQPDRLHPTAAGAEYLAKKMSAALVSKY
jgi:lysophospholipase L1-like esterase